MEIELKLQLTNAGADALDSSGMLPGVPVSTKQRSIYFDTPDQALAKAGLTLRIRMANGQNVQTIKEGNPGKPGLFARPEWEIPVADCVPIDDPRTPVPTLLGDAAGRLAPLFTVEVTRQTWILTEGRARIEAVIDRGEVIAGDRRSAVCEAELELLSGPTAALFAVARRLDAIAPVKLGTMTKSERGYRLIDAARTACKAEDISLETGTTAAEAFQRIALSCLRQFRLNEDLLLVTRSAEPLHQARVSLRRLRSAFTIFRPVIGASGNALDKDLRWLARVLGTARDLDVLSIRMPAGALQDRIRAAREAAYDDVVRTLDSDRARALMLDLTEWLHGGDWLSTSGGAAARDADARDLAFSALSKFRRKVKAGGRDLPSLEDSDRHDLRKDAKKLRYATEFFTSLYACKRHRKHHRRFLSALEAFQDQMGALNDLVSVRTLLERLGLDKAPGAVDLMAQATKGDRLAAAVRTHRRLTDCRKFWT